MKEIVEQFKQYLQAQAELYKFKLVRSLTPILGDFVGVTLLLFGIFFIIFLLNIALGFYLGDLMHNNALGFFIVAIGDLVLLLVVALAYGKKIKKALGDMLARIYMNNKSDNEE